MVAQDKPRTPVLESTKTQRLPCFTCARRVTRDWGAFPFLRRCYGRSMTALFRLLIVFALSLPARAGEWITLFDGKNLDAFTTRGTAEWRVEEGVIKGGQDGDPKKSGLLLTKAKFKDFELELDFMIDEHGKYNSGVYLRNDPAAGGRTGYQINLGRGAAGEYCGGLYTDKWLAKGDEKDAVRKPREWNTLRIVAKGAHIEVTLNGTKVVDFTDPAPPAHFLQEGVIALQTYGAEGHAGWVKFRNIRIRAVE